MKQKEKIAAFISIEFGLVILCTLPLFLLHDEPASPLMFLTSIIFMFLPALTTLIVKRMAHDKGGLFLQLNMALVVSGATCAYSNFFWTKALNPYSLLTNHVLLGKTEFANLGGFPVLTWQAAVWISLTVGLALAAAIYFLSAENCYRCVGRAK